MKITEYLNDNTLIICPREVRLAALGWLNENKLLRSVKFMSLGEYRRNYFFDYDEAAVLYVCQREQCKVSVARMYLDNLCYVEDERDYGNEKLNRLVELKRELKVEGLLTFNPLFHSWLKRVKTVVYGYGELDSFSRKMISGEVIEFPDDSQCKFTVNEFDNLEEEVEWLFNSFVELLNSGVNINRIFVCNLTEEYEAVLRRFERYYGITVDYGKNDSIVGTALVRRFMSWLDYCDHQQIYDQLQQYSDSPIYSQLVHILNKYIEHKDLKEVRELIHDDLMNTKITPPRRVNVVKNIALFSELSEDDHLFVLSFNDDFTPMKTDTDYISDNIKPLVGLDNSEQINLLAKRNTLGYLSTVKNLHLSYCKNSSFNRHNPSTLREDLVNERPQPSWKHSEGYNKARMYYQLEDYLKYREKPDILPRLYGNYNRSGYLEYDNKFKELTDQQKALLEKPRLSYTAMENYNKCSFRYYLDKVLLNRNESTFYTRLGTLFHGVLEHCFTDESFDFDRIYAELSTSGKEKTAQNQTEEFFLAKLKPDLQNAIEIIKEQNQHTMLKQGLYEKWVVWKQNGEDAFCGFIDKVMYYRGKDQTLTAIIDYKTGGSISFIPELNAHGLSMQLPCYLFLLDNMDDRKLGEKSKIIYGGIYLQHILPKKFTYDEKKTEEDQRREYLRWDGYSINDVGLLTMLDDSIETSSRSSNIRSLAIKKDGDFYSSSKVMSEQDIRDCIAATEREIIKARQAISEGRFDINPKFYQGENQACNKCPYADICYHRYEDNVYLDGRIENDDDEDEGENQEEDA